ncbi:MAG: helical backbone metal receptor [Mycobacteriaceae bacterium]
MSRTLRDDLGVPVAVPEEVRRVVSLVPSLTEAVAVSTPGRLVGATDWCTHPADLDVTRVRGTKNPDRAAVTALAPDLVIANQEENRQLDVQRLRADGVPVWVTVTESVPQALASLRRLLVTVLRGPEPEWLLAAEHAWSVPAPATRTAVVPVWRDPWMVVGARTFTGDVLARLGVGNALAEHPERYPHVDPTEVPDVDLVVLPDEPYAFTPDDGPEAFPDVDVALVSGRLLTWYGPSLATARDELTAQLAARRPGRSWAAGRPS